MSYPAPEVRFVQPLQFPSPYSNHVVIERTPTCAIRSSGASNAGGEVEHYYMMPRTTDMSNAIALGSAWAEKNGVPVVYVCNNAL